MDNLKQILLEHTQRYPLMEPTDAVKLIYQNEFGGGHLIRDVESCMNYLQQEYDATPQSESMPLYDDIGNGLVRIHLSALDAHGYTLAQLGDAFIRSAATHTGMSDSFLAKLDILQQLTRDSLMPFGLAELEDYLSTYAAAGYPMVSHSTVYRQHYRPAYRIVKKEMSHISKSV